MSSRLYGLDYLRTFLTMLVIVFHCCVAYGAAGSWYYDGTDKSETTILAILLTIFAAVCQAFFMSLFFFLSGYFVPGSFDRHGAKRFITDRLIRFGIPLLLYMFWIGPSTIYLAARRDEKSYLQFVRDDLLHARIINFGPLWFVEALLYMCVLYALYRLFAPNKRLTGSKALSFPSGAKLLVLAVLFGLIAFGVRFAFPLGTGPLELQLGYFPLYILLFIAGIIAYRNQWLAQIPAKLVKRWLTIALSLIPLLPIFLILTGALEEELTYSGGFHLQAFLYALWEPFICFGICLALIAAAVRKRTRSSRAMNALSSAAYTAYIIHPPIVVSFTILMDRAALAPFVKLITVAPVSVAVCFAIAYAITGLPRIYKNFLRSEQTAEARQ